MADVLRLKGEFNVSSGMLRRTLAEKNLTTCFKDLMDTETIKGGVEFRKRVAEEIGSDSDVLLLEFGVFQGRSMAFWSQSFKGANSTFHGFDSFEGLPETWNRNHPKGTFSTGGAIPQIDDGRVHFHKGWIQNTLPPFLNGLPEAEDRKVICHIDVDLYSATLFVLCSLWPKFQHIFLIFDEFEIEENHAFADFCASFPVGVTWHFHTIAGNLLPGKVFCEIRRIPYEV